MTKRAKKIETSDKEKEQLNGTDITETGGSDTDKVDKQLDGREKAPSASAAPAAKKEDAIAKKAKFRLKVFYSRYSPWRPG